MIDRVKILSARRAYEFAPDDLRLTMLSVAEVRQQIQQHFSFNVAQVAPPLPTFGPVANTIPPGVVFDYGATQTLEGSITPIRFMHFESERIVVDVAGPSSAIDWTFEQLRSVVAKMQAPDGSPVIGVPKRVRNYSEISVRFSFGFEDMVGGPLLKLAQKTFGEEGRSVVPLGVKFRAAEPAEEVHPVQVGPSGVSRGHMIEIRAGTSPEDRTFFSATELPSDQHLAWLESVERELDKS